MQFREIQKLVYKAYKKNKFEEDFNRGGKVLLPHLIQELDRAIKEIKNVIDHPNKDVDYGDVLELAFVVTEIGEAIEYVNNKNEEEVRFEVADAVIRTLNFCNRKGFDLEDYIILKNNKNLKRGKLHGRK